MANSQAFFPQPTNTLSCFYYVGGGERCGAPSPPSAHFCATHLFRIYRTPVENLLGQATEALTRCTSFSESGLISISCKDLDAWGSLSNSVSALAMLGYRREEEALELLLSSLLSNTSFRKVYASKVPKKWKAFEILVARLHVQQLAPLIQAAGEGSRIEDTLGIRVYWDYRKVGRRTGRKRQVDVAIIANLGLYNVFTAIECKDTEVNISDVGAFNTTLDDIGAHKGVIATSIGFQEGAKKTAAAYGIETLHIEEKLSRARAIVRSVPRFKPVVKQIGFEQPDAEARPLGYQLSEIKILLGGTKETSAASLAAEMFNTNEPMVGSWPPQIEYMLPERSVLLLPDLTKLAVKKILIVIKLEVVQERISLTLPECPFAFSIKNVISETVRVVSASDMPVIGPRRLEPGHFYINFMCQHYYCKNIEGNNMTLILLEDRQHGTSISATLHAETRYSLFYFPMEDPAIRPKLESVLQSYISRNE